MFSNSSCDKYCVFSAASVDPAASCWYPLRRTWIPLTEFATAFASKPNVIKNIGPNPPTTTVIIPIAFFIPSGRLLNLSAIFAINSITGVNTLANNSPTGAIETLSFSIDAANLFIGESAWVFNSRWLKIASSSTDALVSWRTRAAWVPSLPKLFKSAEILANWYLPKTFSITLERSRSVSGCSACANPVTVFLRFPWLASTIPLILIPTAAAALDAALLGLIKDASPDLSALAPCAAEIPPSCIAAMKYAKSFTSPPSCWITGATFGIASVKSSSATTVWFSTALRKSIVPAIAEVSIWKAFLSAIVVSNAFSCVTPPSTASLFVCSTSCSNPLPEKPAAAASAAILIVSETLRPYFVYSSPNARIFFKAASVAPWSVNMSP